jgi:hypothetical protein
LQLQLVLFDDCSVKKDKLHKYIFLTLRYSTVFLASWYSIGFPVQHQLHNIRPNSGFKPGKALATDEAPPRTTFYTICYRNTMQHHHIAECSLTSLALSCILYSVFCILYSVFCILYSVCGHGWACVVVNGSNYLTVWWVGILQLWKRKGRFARIEPC